MKKTILLNLDERLYENMEKYREKSGMNKQEFIRTAIWTMCLELETRKLEKKLEENELSDKKELLEEFENNSKH